MAVIQNITFSVTQGNLSETLYLGLEKTNSRTFFSKYSSRVELQKKFKVIQSHLRILANILISISHKPTQLVFWKMF